MDNKTYIPKKRGAQKYTKAEKTIKNTKNNLITISEIEKSQSENTSETFIPTKRKIQYQFFESCKISKNHELELDDDDMNSDKHEQINYIF